ncbi:hypothetical protein FHS51_001521 [Sphingobium wenxiniae]|uniref:Uncharacterized protein n=2 Tax=Sphingobium TaxID=165695 RepID=T0GFB5_9SPHN|nr:MULTISPECIES: hypothetical protein [Sphingobium]EQB02456.1 hypothetical protein L485_08075 [Sphingobium baderi LL03]KMS60821.1 hypothetical protein V475_18040 [Sphingobium baderi LL03]MBB6191294.1 hypothetical protein [Sphingobium wenxiniae]TWH93411.1 hypothetical protein IQ35_02318 [Sphingobium wenxiniae]WRD76057.1 hypothetical protein QQ987_14975 [Sphingobium baderi]
MHKYRSDHRPQTGYSASLLQAAAAIYGIEAAELAEAASKAARTARKYRN